MRFNGLFAGLAVALAPFLCDVALACTCAPLPEPCEAYWDASAVFSGTVVDVSETTVEVPWGEERLSYSQRLVRFSVIDAYRGTAPGSIEVVTGMGDTDCGYAFEVGASYLVYGFGVSTDPRLRAHICSRTRLLADAAADLEYIRGLSRDDTPGRVFGVAMLYDETLNGGGPVYVGALTSAKLVLADGERRYVATTDGNGRFSFDGVPPGTYALKAAAPESAHTERYRVVVKTASCTRIEVRVVAGPAQRPGDPSGPDAAQR
jgi:hypothetical protein